ncbi:hypothetical protein EDEG_01146 [Edhazardia aedis USNM 41457]|uniref:Coatomer subunit zeta n=1 Tax=Edhazardia aedis (strain USNM 41457) TaxID=1003232 RepID=J9DQ30_EDHAE|nr:hypothetical protein EDEG_01146 [Edhazardia aedis USNM 41457]|eukprot:EJW04655.1 hypothetical protein EDEG_01146 [Edhazardia aedis USNM 41457]
MYIHNIECIAILDKACKTLIKREYAKTDIKAVFDHIKSEKDEITIMNDSLVVYKNLDDVIIFISSDININEILIHKALESFYSALVSVLKTVPSVSAINEKYDQIVLLLDSFVYQGILMEDDADKMAQNVLPRPFEGLEGMKIPKGFTSIFSKATNLTRR